MLDVLLIFEWLQANLATVRELKYGVEKMSKANNVANFTLALIKAFEVLDFVSSYAS